MPPLPDKPGTGYSAFPGLTLLPDGALLAAGNDGWYRLPASARSLQTAGERLWWLQGESAAITAGSAPLSRLTCR